MKVLVVYYSLYGHVLQLAQAVVAGVKSVAGVEAVLRRVQEFPEVEQEMSQHPHALEVWNRQKDIPVCTLDDLKAADGILFGTPTRYGNMIAQMKRLIDSTVTIWFELRRQAGRRLYLLGQHPRRAGDHLLYHDGAAAAPGPHHCRGALFDPGDAA